MKGFKPSKMKAHKMKSNNKISKKTMLFISIISLLVIAIVVGTVFLLPNITNNGQEIKEISIERLPDKIIYHIEDKPNYDGLKILVTLNNGETYLAPIEECQITGFDSSTPTDHCAITVVYKGYYATFPVVIKEKFNHERILVGISLETLPKTNYKVGESLSAKDGVILCEYQDGSTHRVNLTKPSIEGEEVAFEQGIAKYTGTYILTVRFTEENGISATCTFTITITN